MNNSKLSVAASSPDAFTEPRTYGYRPSWDQPPEDLLQSDIAFHSGRRSDSTVGLESTAVHDLPNTQGTQVRPRLEAKRLDLGLWLLCGSATRQGRWEHLQGMTQSVAGIRNANLACSSILKRACDVVGSLFLLVALFPLFTLIAALIKLDSRGPVFFRHYRVGKGGNNFVLWKFRSMRTDVPKYAASPRNAADVRLTRVGRLIRRLSIDEMPQLINVLKGEMSLVGPRPEMPFIVDLYHPAECERFVVRPGITGLWQISPARAFPIHENLQYDLHYIHNRNFLLDCTIILHTITAVIHGIGAV
jgi:lipopolysaccharide/colanic/teichoic acid biosynthesis glycosyltransferase